MPEPATVMEEAKDFEHKEAYQTLHKESNYRIGVGISQNGCNNAHEKLVSQFWQTKEFMEKIVKDCSGRKAKSSSNWNPA
jgi:hypothetical protein